MPICLHTLAALVLGNFSFASFLEGAHSDFHNCEHEFNHRMRCNATYFSVAVRQQRRARICGRQITVRNRALQAALNTLHRFRCIHGKPRTHGVGVCPVQRLVRQQRPSFQNSPLRVRPSEYLMSVILQPSAAFASKTAIFSLTPMSLKDAATSAESFC